MSGELSVYHTRRLAQARQRTAELRDLKTTAMTQDELFMWLTRMEIVARDLLNVVDVQAARHAMGANTR
jgi:arsenate reductase-like glutaredoxin family protein